MNLRDSILAIADIGTIWSPRTIELTRRHATGLEYAGRNFVDASVKGSYMKQRLNESLSFNKDSEKSQMQFEGHSTYATVTSQRQRCA